MPSERFPHPAAKAEARACVRYLRFLVAEAPNTLRVSIAREMADESEREEIDREFAKVSAELRTAADAIAKGQHRGGRARTERGALWRFLLSLGGAAADIAPFVRKGRHLARRKA